MDALKFIEERNRMCERYWQVDGDCDGCPLAYEGECNELRNMVDGAGKAVGKVVEIIEKWSQEHPRKTRQDEDDRIFQIRTGDYLVKTGADAFIPIPPELFERAYDRLEQEPATWVWDDDAIDWGLGAWVCSRCHGRNANIHAGKPGYDNSISANPYAWAGAQYCPNCGAPMRERKERQ